MPMASILPGASNPSFCATHAAAPADAIPMMVKPPPVRTKLILGFIDRGDSLDQQPERERHLKD
jgi:hypothetical protein